MSSAVALGINPQGRVILYGADWCPDCRRAKSYRGDNDIKFQYIDVDEHDWATAEIESINDGKRTIPTILVGETWHVITQTGVATRTVTATAPTNEVSVSPLR